MTNISQILTGTAGLAALVAVASPAAAQVYPGYGQYPQQNNSGIVGAIINSVTGGYGQYPQGNYGYGQVSDRQLVGQCAAAAEQRLNAGYRGQGYGAYNGQNGYQNGYGANGYRQGGARVVGITNVERRNNGGLRVSGVATSGQVAYANQGYNGYGQGGYNAQQVADLRFTCKVNQRNQITEVKVNRNQPAYGRRY